MIEFWITIAVLLAIPVAIVVGVPVNAPTKVLLGVGVAASMVLGFAALLWLAMR